MTPKECYDSVVQKGCPVEVQGQVSIGGRYNNLTAAIEVGKCEREGTDAVEGIVQSTK